MTTRRDLTAFPLSIMRGKAEENDMGAWFSQEPGMGTLEESQQDTAVVRSELMAGGATSCEH